MIEAIKGHVTKYKSSHPSNADDELIVFPLGLILIARYGSVTIVLDKADRLFLASAIEALFEQGYKLASNRKVYVQDVVIYWSNRGEPYAQGIEIDTRSAVSVFVDDDCVQDLINDLRVNAFCL